MNKKLVIGVVALALIVGGAVYFSPSQSDKPCYLRDTDDLIKNINIRPDALVKSPLKITGQARGCWYFEASFPIRISDSNGKELGLAVAQAQGEWMTENFVPFSITLNFSRPSTSTGFLVLHKDNPSGLPEHDDELRIPVRFADYSAEPVAKACVISGCSGQICAEEEMVTTCEYREEYACYKSAKCERQTNGACGWTDTSVLRACLSNPI